MPPVSGGHNGGSVGPKPLIARSNWASEMSALQIEAATISAVSCQSQVRRNR